MPRQIITSPQAHQRGEADDAREARGQLSIDLEGNVVGAGDIRAQTRQVLENVRAIVEAAGGTLRDVIKTGQSSLLSFLKNNDLYDPDRTPSVFQGNDRKTWANFLVAWKALDADAFAALYVEDATVARRPRARPASVRQNSHRRSHRSHVVRQPKHRG